MKMTITLTVLPWEKTKHNGQDASVRKWSGGTNDGPNLAARVVCHRKWPFSSWEWAVWDPFHNKSSADGNATTQAGAERAADEALAALIAEAERENPLPGPS